MGSNDLSSPRSGLTARIVGTEQSTSESTGKPFVRYVIAVRRNGKTVATAKHRYTDFVYLHESIDALKGTQFPVPKTVMPVTPDALQRREEMLNDYLVFLLDKVPVRQRAAVHQFLNIPNDETDAEGAGPRRYSPGVGAPELSTHNDTDVSTGSVETYHSTGSAAASAYAQQAKAAAAEAQNPYGGGAAANGAAGAGVLSKISPSGSAGQSARLGSSAGGSRGGGGGSGLLSPGGRGGDSTSISVPDVSPEDDAGGGKEAREAARQAAKKKGGAHLFTCPRAVIIILCTILPLEMIVVMVGAGMGSPSPQPAAKAAGGSNPADDFFAGEFTAFALSRGSAGAIVGRAGEGYFALCPGALDPYSAQVACRQLGYPGQQSYGVVSEWDIAGQLGVEAAPLAVTFSCKGDETDLVFCQWHSMPHACVLPKSARSTHDFAPAQVQALTCKPGEGTAAARRAARKAKEQAESGRPSIFRVLLIVSVVVLLTILGALAIPAVRRWALADIDRVPWVQKLIGGAVDSAAGGGGGSGHRSGGKHTHSHGGHRSAKDRERSTDQLL